MSKKQYKLPDTAELFDAGVHFGHHVRRWHPYMEKYIYTVRKGIHIVDLGKTSELLEKACDYLYELASNGGQIVFIGTKRQAREIIEIEAKRSGAFFVTERWLGGTITNFEIVRKTIEKLVSLKKNREEGNFMKYTKKERLLIDREIEKLEKLVGGLVGLKKIPSALFIVDARREKTAIREAAVSGTKVISLVDTNTNPSNIAHVIPGNDDGIKAIALIIKAVADALEAGYKEYAKKLEKGKAPEVIASATPVETTSAIQTKVSSTESPVASEVAGKNIIKNPEDVVEIVTEEDAILDKLEKSVVDQIKKIEEVATDEVVAVDKAPKVKKPKINKTKKEAKK